jgi:mannose-6-phosphate isomerase
MTTAAELPVRAVAKPWGRDTLPAPFTAPPGERIGEIWFEPDAAIPGLLVKYLFTSEKLSVQVHPSDAQAGPGEVGKEEGWLVLDAEPDARLAIGFREPVDPATMRAAALDGSIEGLLEWHPVRRGDFFYLPAGTVHAIGPGLSLIEIQQNSDTTYRLYDYGRPRELHLDAGIAVASGARYPSGLKRRVEDGEDAVLVEGPLFRLEQVAGVPGPEVLARFPGEVLIVPVAGTVAHGDARWSAGSCLRTGDVSAVTFAPDGRYLLVRSLA